MEFEQRHTVSMDECLTMAGDKTAALMACACSIGAIFTGAPPSLAMSLADFGSHTGLAFQLVDDLLGIWGAPEVTGKPVWSDLRTRKKTLPVVAAMAGSATNDLASRELNRPARPRGSADRGRPQPGRLAGRGGGRPQSGPRRSRPAARGGLQVPRRSGDPGGRACRTDRDSAVRRGPGVVRART